MFLTLPTDTHHGSQSSASGMQVPAHRPLGLGTRARPCGPLPVPPALLRSLSLLHLDSPGPRISALGATLGRRTLFYSHTVGKEGNGPKEAEGMSGEATGVPSTCGLWGGPWGEGMDGENRQRAGPVSACPPVCPLTRPAVTEWL